MKWTLKSWLSCAISAVLLPWCIVWATQTAWTGGKWSVLNPGATDTIASTGACTLDVAGTCGSFYRGAAGSNTPLVMTGFPLTFAYKFVVDSASVLKFGTRLEKTGDGDTLRIGAGVAAPTSAQCTTYFDGTGVLAINKATTTWGPMFGPNTGKTMTNIGASQPSWTATAHPLTGRGGNITTNSNAMYFALSASDTFVTGVSVFSSSATGILFFKPVANTKCLVPATTFGGSGTFGLTYPNVNQIDTITYLGRASATSFTVPTNGNYAATYHQINFRRVVVTGAAGLSMGNQQPAGLADYNFAADTDTVTTFKTTQYSIGPTRINLQTSKINISADYLLTTHDTVYPGTSVLYFNGAAASTYKTPAPAQQLAYDIEQNMTTGKRLNDSSNVRGHNFTRNTGTHAMLGHKETWSGNYVVNSANAADSLLARVSGDTIAMTGGLFQITTAGKLIIDSISLQLNGATTINLDSNISIKNLLVSNNVKITGPAGKKITMNQAGTWGTGDSSISGTPGSAWTLSRVATPIALTGSYFKDTKIFGGTIYDTSGTGYDGGGDSNYVVDTLKFTLISPSTVPAGGGVCSLTVVHGRTAGGALTVGGASTAITSQAAALWVFTAPAHAAGAVTVAGSNGNGLTTGSIQLTYLSGTRVLTMAAAHGTTTPAIGDTTVGASAVNISHGLVSGWKFWKWTRNGANVTFGDSSLNITTATLTGDATVTAVDTSDPAVPANLTWSGNGRYATAARWDLARVPGAIDTATIPTGICSLMTVQRVAQIKQSGGTLYMGPQRDSVTTLSVSAGTLTQAGDTLVLLGNATINATATVTSTAATLWRILTNGVTLAYNAVTGLPRHIFSRGATITGGAGIASIKLHATDTLVLEKGKLIALQTLDSADWSGTTKAAMTYFKSSTTGNTDTSRAAISTPSAGRIGLKCAWLQRIRFTNDTLYATDSCRSGGAVIWPR